MSREFTAIFEKHGRWYIGYVEEIPGVNTQDKTLSEARENLKEALQLILARIDDSRQGTALPLPSAN
jgi:predicted RNase H-like HicB family nuclease